MSTVAYAALTNARENAPPGTSATTTPGVGSYIDIFNALVPAEVLSLHVMLMSVTTEQVEREGKTAVQFKADALATLQYSFWALIAFSILLYVVPRMVANRWEWRDCVRAAIAPVAFVGWTMLQQATTFDAAFPHLGMSPRTVIALFIAAILIAVTQVLATAADQRTIAGGGGEGPVDPGGGAANADAGNQGGGG